MRIRTKPHARSPTTNSVRQPRHSLFASRPFFVEEPAPQRGTTHQWDAETAAGRAPGGLDSTQARVAVSDAGLVQAKPADGVHEGSSENRTGLPEQLKTGIERLSGLSMDDVRVHYNSPEPAGLQASAYTQGADIHVGPGQERYLSHEAWHVVQQMRGRARPTLHAKAGVAIDDDAGLEEEADVMGAKALRMSTPGGMAGSSISRAPHAHQRPSRPTTSAAPAASFWSRIVQRAITHDDPEKVESHGRAGKVKVTNISGKPLGLGANSPGVGPFGWNELYDAKHTLGHPDADRSHYNAVRMHLWSGRLGGPGKKTWNLAPGPAQVNSLMSGGPETKAKDAVAAGRKIWLETAVTYASNSGLANDFASVIPNNISMKWGYMKPDGTPDAEVAPTWSQAIDQPAGAMSLAQKGAYTALTDMDTANLDGLLTGQSRQVLAQAYVLVTTALKKHMLLTYRDVYLGMDPDGQKAAVSPLTSDERFHLINTTLGYANDVGSITWVLSRIYNDSAKLVPTFALFTAIKQKEIAKYANGEILQFLNGTALALASNDYSIFKLLSDEQKAAVLNGLSAAQIDGLLGGAAYSDLFKGWAKQQGLTKAVALRAFFQPRISAGKYNGCEDTWFRWVQSAENSRNAQKENPRPPRRAKKT